MNVTRHPIIVTGMHRSGTSLLTRMLDEYGIFIGAKSHHHAEDVFFRRINQQIYETAHAYWDYPEPVRQIHCPGPVRDALQEYINTQLNTIAIRGYLGWSRWLRVRSLKNIDFPWGWKDPRNTFTLPLWLRVFPDAFVIRVSRNGIDVARSLQKRELRRVTRGSLLQTPLLSTRCLTLDGAFSLWAEHEAMGQESEALIAGERSYHLRFEDLVGAPALHFARLLGALGLPIDKTTINDITASINPKRAWAFRGNDRLEELNDRVKQHPSMVALGYHEPSHEHQRGH